MIFQSTLSLRRATDVDPLDTESVMISIHALLAESDKAQVRSPLQGLDFNPRSPCGERRAIGAPHTLTAQISIHALLAESDYVRLIVGTQQSISIHALLAESDGLRRFL